MKPTYFALSVERIREIDVREDKMERERERVIKIERGREREKVCV